MSSTKIQSDVVKFHQVQTMSLGSFDLSHAVSGSVKLEEEKVEGQRKVF